MVVKYNYYQIVGVYVFSWKLCSELFSSFHLTCYWSTEQCFRGVHGLWSELNHIINGLVQFMKTTLIKTGYFFKPILIQFKTVENRFASL